jgi:hypothetical protein
MAEMYSVQQSDRDPATGRFNPSNCANPAGRPTKAQRAALVRKTMIKLARPLGGLRALNSLDLERLRLAAELAQRQPKNAEDRVRVANAIDRMLGSIERARLTAAPQRRQSTRGHMPARGELPRSLATLVRPKKP